MRGERGAGPCIRGLSGGTVPPPRGGVPPPRLHHGASPGPETRRGLQPVRGVRRIARPGVRLRGSSRGIGDPLHRQPVAGAPGLPGQDGGPSGARSGRRPGSPRHGYPVRKRRPGDRKGRGSGRPGSPVSGVPQAGPGGRERGHRRGFLRRRPGVALRRDIAKTSAAPVRRRGRNSARRGVHRRSRIRCGAARGSALSSPADHRTRLPQAPRIPPVSDLSGKMAGGGPLLPGN